MFIQYIQGKCQRPDDLRRLLDRWESELGPNAPGWLGATHGITDDGTACATVRFESREAAEQNAARPEQDQWFNEMQKCFTGPLEFVDCDDVEVLLDGGSDDAGFVQVMRGRVLDMERMRSMISHTDLLRQMRPEVIGATLGITEDGRFVQTIAFTDEESARRGEQQEMPAEVAEDMQGSMGDLTFLDLHEPWFASPS